MAEEPLPARRETITQKFAIRTDKGKFSLYVIVGLREDSRPGEVKIVLSRTGSLERAWSDNLGQAISIAMQYGTPLERFVAHFVGTRFPPAGPVTGYDGIKFCSSPLDLTFRWMGIEFCGMEDLRIGEHRGLPGPSPGDTTET